MRASPNRGLTDTKFIMPKCRNKREAIAAHEFDRTEKPRPLRQGPGLDLPTAAKPRLVRGRHSQASPATGFGSCYYATRMKALLGNIKAPAVGAGELTISLSVESQGSQ